MCFRLVTFVSSQSHVLSCTTSSSGRGPPGSSLSRASGPGRTSCHFHLMDLSCVADRLRVPGSGKLPLLRLPIAQVLSGALFRLCERININTVGILPNVENKAR